MRSRHERAASAPAVFPIERLELTFEPRPWPYAGEKRAEIDAFFAELQRKVPSVWNGRVLLLHRHVIADGVFAGAYLETDYASFAAWRGWGRPPAGVHDCFGAAAVIAGDGGVLLGVMGQHTANHDRVWAALKAWASGQVSKMCGARLRSARPAPSLSRMNALVV